MEISALIFHLLPSNMSIGFIIVANDNTQRSDFISICSFSIVYCSIFFSLLQMSFLFSSAFFCVFSLELLLLFELAKERVPIFFSPEENRFVLIFLHSMFHTHGPP